MNEEQFPSNKYDADPFGNSSLRTGYRNEEVPATVERKKHNATAKKLTFGERIVDNFQSIDYKKVGNHLIFEWFVPELISMVGNFLKKIFYGDGSMPNINKSSDNRAVRVAQYHQPFANNNGIFNPMPQVNFRKIEVVFGPTKDGMTGYDNAMDALDQIRENLAMSNANPPRVSVREFYSVCGMPTNNTMNRWGWYDLEDVNIIQYDNEAALQMPPAMEIEI